MRPRDSWSEFFFISIILIGIGSAIFHAAGGAMAIRSTPERAVGPGVFAAFGVVGLALGLRLALYDSLWEMNSGSFCW